MNGRVINEFIIHNVLIYAVFDGFRYIFAFPTFCKIPNRLTLARRFSILFLYGGSFSKLMADY